MMIFRADMMRPKKAVSKEEAEAKTSVWWNINEFPVPCGYDAGRIRECIERALEKLGYSGRPVTISAYGDLHQTPEHVLRALSSTGIILNCSFRVNPHMYSDVLEWRSDNPPPATIMLINLAQATQSMFGTSFHSTDEEGYNIVAENDGWLKLIEGARDSESTREIRRGRQFTLDKSCSVTLDKSCSESYSPFYCCLCCFDAQTFESFNLHLKGEKHFRLGSCFFTHLPDQASHDSHPKTATTMVMEEPPKKRRKTSKDADRMKYVIPPTPKILVEANKVKKKLKKKKKKLMKKMLTE